MCCYVCGVQNRTCYKISAIKISALIFIFRDSQGRWRGQADQKFLPWEGFSESGDLSEMIPCTLNVCDAISSGVLSGMFPHIILPPLIFDHFMSL